MMNDNCIHQSNGDFLLFDLSCLYTPFALHCSLTSPMLLIVLGLCGGAVYWVGARNQSQPMKLMGKHEAQSITLMEKRILPPETPALG